jgi:CDP-glucose 4,6-dehydratase
MKSEFWKNKKVFITGHTGFKGAWLCLYLESLGAQVTGFSLEPPTNPSLFELCEIDKKIHRSIHGDVNNLDYLKKQMHDSAPEIVFHMAAQSLVRESYVNPIYTYMTNVMGTANVLESVRDCKSIKSVVIVTTDKCYENKEWAWGYREGEPLGGYDPYSSSKACAELVTSAYRNSFFKKADSNFEVGIASARAGNVIGGGDFAKDRLIPDCVKSILNKEPIVIRNPNSIRPWQHVLEPLSGYIILAEKLYEAPNVFSNAWNFGPNDSDAKPVSQVVESLLKYNKLDYKTEVRIFKSDVLHEAHYLKLDISKARTELDWKPKWNLENALDKIMEWVFAYKSGKNILSLTLGQIEEYKNTV